MTQANTTYTCSVMNLLRQIFSPVVVWCSSYVICEIIINETSNDIRKRNVQECEDPPPIPRITIQLVQGTIATRERQTKSLQHSVVIVLNILFQVLTNVSESDIIDVKTI
jgi:hypothetical protein